MQKMERVMAEQHERNLYHTAPFAQFAKVLDYPVYIVTTAVDGERSGCLIGFATQCSIHPPRFLACISKKNHTYELVRRASVLAVHVVGDEHKALADLFGGTTGDEIDKFSRVEWHEEYGVPILDACECWFAGAVERSVDFGDHVGFVLAPLGLEAHETDSQLSFQSAKSIKPGHPP